MSREAISHAFDRPAAASRAPADRGLGLGLPLARQSVEAHGGPGKRISEPGEGTVIGAETARRHWRSPKWWPAERWEIVDEQDGGGGGRKEEMEVGRVAS